MQKFEFIIFFPFFFFQVTSEQQSKFCVSPLDYNEILMVENFETSFETENDVLNLQNIPFNKTGSFSFWYRAVNQIKQNFTSNYSIYENITIEISNSYFPSFSMMDQTKLYYSFLNLSQAYGVFNFGNQNRNATLLSFGDNFFIYFVEQNNKCFFLNLSEILITKLSNFNNLGWMWIYFGLNYENNNRLIVSWAIWSQGANNLQTLKVNITINLTGVDALNINSLNVGSGSSVVNSQYCSCKMKNFKYYNFDFTNLADITTLINAVNVLPLARIYFNQTVADNLIPFLPQNNNLLQIFHGDLTVTKDEHTVINTQLSFANVSDYVIIESNVTFDNYMLGFWMKVANYSNINFVIFESVLMDPIQLRLYVSCSSKANGTSDFSMEFVSYVNDTIATAALSFDNSLLEDKWIFFFVQVQQRLTITWANLTMLLNNHQNYTMNLTFENNISDPIFSTYSIYFNKSIENSQAFLLKKIELYYGNIISNSTDCPLIVGANKKYMRFDTDQVVNGFEGCKICPNGTIIGSDGVCHDASNYSCDSTLNLCSNESSTNNSNKTNNTNITNNTNNTNDSNNTNNNNKNNNSDINSSNITCNKGQAKINDQCINCSKILGINDDCSDICGNGYLFNFTNNIQCDDGNINSGDGCSSDCHVEKNFHCLRQNYSIPDKCINLSPLVMTLSMTKSANVVFLNLNRLILNYTFNNDFLLNHTKDIFAVEIECLESNEYSYEILFQNPSKIEINFEFSTSFNSLELKIMVISPEIIRDENNVSLIGLNPTINTTNKSKIILTGKFPLYLKTSVEYQKKIEKLYENSRIVSYSALVLSSIPFYWLCLLQFLWFMIDSMQVTNFFLYFNIILPFNARTILMIFADSNLYFLSNFLNGYLGVKYISNDFDINIYTLIKAPPNFEDLGITSLFILNSGALVLLTLLLYALYAVKLIIINQRLLINNKSLNEAFLKLRKYFTLPEIIRIQSIFFLSICLATCLQFRSFSTLNTEYFYNYIMAFLSTLYIICFLIYMFKTSNNVFTFFNEKEFLDHFSPIFGDSNMQLLIGRNNFLIVCGKKIFISTIIVFFYDWPYVVIAFFLVFQALELYCVFKYEVFSLKSINYFVRFSDIMFFLALVIILIMKIYFDIELENAKIIPLNSVNLYFAFGWVLISLVFSIIGCFFLIVNWSIIVVIKKFIERKMKEKLRKLHACDEKSMQELISIDGKNC